jgi:DNA-binding FadR family transcriptional regulator
MDQMPRTNAVEIAGSLGKRIRAGEWAETGRMPPERDLAAAYRVARNTLRRAMDLLEREGTISRHVGRGTFVNAAARASLADVVARIEGAAPADMMELRLLLEPSAAAFAATNASAAEIELVRAAHDRACVADDVATFEHWDAELHHRIFTCSRNALLKDLDDLLRTLRNRSPWLELKRRSFSQDRRLRYCDEHAAVVDAVLRRSPDEARAAMQAHLETVRANVIGR